MNWAAQIEMFPQRERNRKRCVWAVEDQEGKIRLCGRITYWQSKDRKKITLCNDHKRQADDRSIRPDGFRYLGELKDASQG